MSAVTAKAMNSTIGTGEIIGLDILLKNAMMEVLQEDIRDRNKHNGLVAGGKIAASNSTREEDRYFYLGKKERKNHCKIRSSSHFLWLYYNHTVLNK